MEIGKFRKISNYVLAESIGGGQFGTVWKAYDERNNDILAIKQVQKSKLVEPKLKDLFMTEINIMKKINNQNVVKLYNFLETTNNCYVVMEFCDGGDLEKHISTKGYLSEEESVTKLKQLLNGFKALHENSIIHRDFKTANIFLHGDEVKIGDFGFAKEADLTVTVLGTPLYMAPEIIDHKQYTNKSDIWSLGIVFYEMLFGQHPFPAKNEAQLKQLIRQCKFQLSTPKIKISQNCQDLLKKMLVNDANQRIEWKDLYTHPLIISSFQQPQPKINSIQEYKFESSIINEKMNNINNMYNQMDIESLNKQVENQLKQELLQQQQQVQQQQQPQQQFNNSKPAIVNQQQSNNSPQNQQQQQNNNQQQKILSFNFYSNEENNKNLQQQQSNSRNNSFQNNNQINNNNNQQSPKQKNNLNQFADNVQSDKQNVGYNNQFQQQQQLNQQINMNNQNNNNNSPENNYEFKWQIDQEPKSQNQIIQQQQQQQYQPQQQENFSQKNNYEDMNNIFSNINPNKKQQKYEDQMIQNNLEFYKNIQGTFVVDQETVQKNLMYQARQNPDQIANAQEIQINQDDFTVKIQFDDIVKQKQQQQEILHLLKMYQHDQNKNKVVKEIIIKLIHNFGYNAQDLVLLFTLSRYYVRRTKALLASLQNNENIFDNPNFYAMQKHQQYQAFINELIGEIDDYTAQNMQFRFDLEDVKNHPNFKKDFKDFLTKINFQLENEDNNEFNDFYKSISFDYFYKIMDHAQKKEQKEPGKSQALYVCGYLLVETLYFDQKEKFPFYVTQQINNQQVQKEFEFDKYYQSINNYTLKEIQEKLLETIGDYVNQKM